MGCKAVPSCRFEFTLHSLVLVAFLCRVDHQHSYTSRQWSTFHLSFSNKSHFSDYRHTKHFYALSPREFPERRLNYSPKVVAA